MPLSSQTRYSFSHIFRLFYSMLILKVICAVNFPPKIIKHPQDWFLDRDIFSSGQPYWTSASVHDPPGIAMFTCEANGTQPLTFKWYVIELSNYRLGYRSISSDTSFWSNGTTLIVKQMEFIGSKTFLCGVTNQFGSEMSRKANFTIIGKSVSESEIGYFTIPTPTFSFPTTILGCYRYPNNVITYEVSGGPIIIFQGYDAYNYTVKYSERERAYMNFYFGNGEKHMQRGFVFEPFIVINSSSVGGPLQVLCSKEYNPYFIVNATQTELKGFPLPPKSTKPVRYFIEFVYQSNPTAVRLQLLYNPPSDGFHKRSYQVGDNFKLACIASVPTTVSVSNFSWIGPDKKTIKTADKHVNRRISVLNHHRLAVVLNIKQIQTADSGNYTCVISFRNGTLLNQKSATVYVEPHQQIQFLNSSNESYKVVDEGQQITLVCKFKASTLPRRVVWLHNGRSISDEMSSTFISNYSIRSLDVELHRGIYQCLIQEESPDLWNIFYQKMRSRPIRRARKRRQVKRVEKIIQPPIFHFNYASQTVARLIVRCVNNYYPVIVSVYGNDLTYDITERLSNLTVIVVSDKDLRSSGRIYNCWATCLPKDAPCPAVNLINRNSLRNVSDSFKTGTVSFVRQPRVTEKWTVRVNISCSDSGEPQRSSSMILQVLLCDSKASCPANRTRANTVTRELVNLATTETDSMNASQLKGYVQKLEVVTGIKPQNLSVVDQYLAVDSLEAVIDRTERSPSLLPPVMANLTSAVGNILRVSSAVLQEGQRQARVASRLLSDISRITRQIPVKNISKITWHTTNLVLGATQPKPTISIFVRLDVALKLSEVESANILSSNYAYGKQYGATIAVRTQAVAGGRVDFSLFTKDSLFEALAINRTHQRRKKLISPVIAARSIITKDSKDPVILTFDYDYIPEIDKKTAKLECSFWNLTDNRWDTSGCQVSSTSGRRTICKCSHLTNFALLMTVDRSGERGGRHHSLALQILSTVTLVISCLALALTLIVYSSFLSQELKLLRSGRRNSSAGVTASRILLCLCASLLTGHLIFLAGGHHQNDDRGCKVVAVLLHFLYLSVFSWSVVESANIFISLIYVSLKSDRIQFRVSHFFWKASLAAWVCPALIVIITLAVNTDNYGLVMASSNDSEVEKTNGLCFLKDTPFYLAFLMPVSICLFTNIVTLLLLILILKQQTAGSRFKDQKASWRQRLFGFIGVCLLLNVTWIIGAFQIGGATLAFMYIFVLVNGLQGISIFLLYCVQRVDIRLHMLKLLRLNRCLTSKATDEKGRSSSTYKTNQSTFSDDQSNNTKAAPNLGSSKEANASVMSKTDETKSEEIIPDSIVLKQDTDEISI